MFIAVVEKLLAPCEESSAMFLREIPSMSTRFEDGFSDAERATRPLMLFCRQHHPLNVHLSRSNADKDGLSLEESQSFAVGTINGKNKLIDHN